MSTSAASRSRPEIGSRLAPRSLEPERHRDDGDRERAELARKPRDDGCCTAAGAATLADGDEDHVRAAQRLAQAIAAGLGDALAELVVASGAEPAGLLASERDLDGRIGHRELLRVGVDGDELDAAQVGLDHARDRVHAGATDADDADAREIARCGACRGSERKRVAHR